jgi:hypothetical protein
MQAVGLVLPEGELCLRMVPPEAAAVATSGGAMVDFSQSCTAIAQESDGILRTASAPAHVPSWLEHAWGHDRRWTLVRHTRIQTPLFRMKLAAFSMGSCRCSGSQAAAGTSAQNRAPLVTCRRLRQAYGGGEGQRKHLPAVLC